MRLAVGIDISKGKSTVAFAREDRKKEKSFEIKHTKTELAKFVKDLKSRDAEIKVVCEETGNYAAPVIRVLQENGIFVSCVNPVVIKRFSDEEIHRVKTDKADAQKIARYCLLRWFELEETMKKFSKRDQLKLLNHQREFSVSQNTGRINSLIALTDRIFPGINELFSKTSKPGREKWVDFLDTFWHPEVVLSNSEEEFKKKYQDWCHKKGYNFQENKANEIYKLAQEAVYSLDKDMTTKKILKQSIKRVKSSLEEVERYNNLLISEAKKMREFEVVRAMPGVGDLAASELIAEIGDVRRFQTKKALIAYSGIDPGVNQSGSYEKKSNSTSKKGDSYLRKTLFNVMLALIRQPPSKDTEVYDYLDKKRKQGKPYRVYMIAGCNKFLKIYFGKVTSYLNAPE